MILSDIDLHLSIRMYIKSLGGVPEVTARWNEALPQFGNLSLARLNFESETIPVPGELDLIPLYEAQVLTWNQADSERAAAIASLKTTAQSSVGMVYTSLDNTQLRALVAILLWQNGAINQQTLAIRPLADWVRPS